MSSFGETDGQVYSISVMVQSSLIISGGSNSSLLVWDPRARTPQNRMGGGHNTTYLSVISPQNFKSLNFKNIIKSKTNQSGSFSMNLHNLFSGNKDGAVEEYDMRKPELPLRIFRAHKYDCSTIDLDPSGTKLLTGSGDKTLKIFDLGDSENEVQRFSFFEEKVVAAEWNSFVPVVLSCSRDRKIDLFGSVSFLKEYN